MEACCLEPVGRQSEGCSGVLGAQAVPGNLTDQSVVQGVLLPSLGSILLQPSGAGGQQQLVPVLHPVASLGARFIGEKAHFATASMYSNVQRLTIRQMSGKPLCEPYRQCCRCK